VCPFRRRGEPGSSLRILRPAGERPLRSLRLQQNLKDAKSGRRPAEPRPAAAHHARVPRRYPFPVGVEGIGSERGVEDAPCAGETERRAKRLRAPTEPERGERKKYLPSLGRQPSSIRRRAAPPAVPICRRRRRPSPNCRREKGEAPWKS
jgi:hypothetical protein